MTKKRRALKKIYHKKRVLTKVKAHRRHVHKKVPVGHIRK